MVDQLAYFAVTTGTPGVYSFDPVTSVVAAVGPTFTPGPMAITPANSTLYVITEPAGSPGTIAYINLATSVTSTFALGAGKVASWLAIDPTGTYLYVVDNVNFVVYQVATATNTITATSATILGTGSTPNLFITVAPNGANAYISGFNGSEIQVISLPSMTITHTFSSTSSGPTAYGIVAVTPDSSTGFTFIAGATVDELAVINLSTNTVSSTIALSTLATASVGWGYQFNGTSLFTVLQIGTASGVVAQIDYATNTWIANITLPKFSQGIGITSSGSELIDTQQPGATDIVLTALPSHTQTTVTTAGNSTFLVMAAPPSTEQIVMIV